MAAERFHARAEFRRADRAADWVLAGVWVEHVRFVPARPGVEPVIRRLPEGGLLGWAELPTILAPDERSAGDIALDVARSTWPDRSRRSVPYAHAPDRR